MANPDCTTHQPMEPGVPPGNNPQVIYNEGNTDCLVLQRRGVHGVPRADRRQGHGHFAFFARTQGHAGQTLKLPKGPGFPMEKTMGSWLPWVY